MKTQKKKIGNVGMRLKPNEPNLLENYSKYRSRKPRKKKKKKKKPKKSIKQIKVLPNVDPFQRIVDDADKKVKEEITVEEKEEPKKEAPSQETRKIVVQKGPQDLSDTDPGVKNLMITASLEPDKKKKGTTIQI
jgi:hypothetical protein